MRDHGRLVCFGRSNGDTHFDTHERAEKHDRQTATENAVCLNGKQKTLFGKVWNVLKSLTVTQ